MIAGIPERELGEVSDALGDLLNEVVFVGGAVVGLYVDDPAAPSVRPTKDVDIVIEVLSASALESLREVLRARGFKQSPQDTVICRFRLAGILVDVLSTKAVGWAPSNRWFAPGYTKLIQKEVSGHAINLLPLPYFLATKLEAFKDRGRGDVRLSHDLEDVVYVLDNNSTWAEEIIAIDDSLLQDYLLIHFESMEKDTAIKEAVLGHLGYSGSQARYQKILNKFISIKEKL